jgi:hypothetical protein
VAIEQPLNLRHWRIPERTEFSDLQVVVAVCALGYQNWSSFVYVQNCNFCFKEGGM